MFLEDPVDLLFFAPHHGPVIVVGLFPLPFDEGVEYAVFEGGFELNVGAE
jgi:hypothetical protein